MSEDTYPHELAGDPARPPRTPPAEVLTAWQDYEDQLAGGLDDGPLIAAATDWRLAASLTVLFAEVNAAHPGRSRRSDGTIGDPRHQALKSDHNPGIVVGKTPVVRAGDITNDPALNMPAALERMRALAHAGKLPQLLGGGYLIHAGKITAPDFAGWREYTGENPHVTHGHVSVSRDPARFDDRRPWGVWTAPKPPSKPTPPPQTPPAPAPAVRDATGAGQGFRADIGDTGPRIKALQTFLRRRYPLYAKHLALDGVYGKQTAAVIAEFARRSKIRADGANVGPQIARRLYVAGFRG